MVFRDFPRDNCAKNVLEEKSTTPQLICAKMLLFHIIRKYPKENTSTENKELHVVQAVEVMMVSAKKIDILMIKENKLFPFLSRNFRKHSPVGKCYHNISHSSEHS